jgi:PAS domain S-box-containing protein
LIAMIWFGALERRNFERREAVERAMELNASMASAFEEQTRRAIANVDQVLLLVVSANQVEPGTGLGFIDQRTRASFDPQLFANLSVTDREGRSISSLQSYISLDVSDRDYFRFHRERPDGGLFIGKPTPGRMMERTVIHIARRINDPHGNFNGVAVASIDPSYFASFYKGNTFGSHGVVQLIRMDGVALARRHGNALRFGEDMRDSLLLRNAVARNTGSFVSRGRGDGLKRYLSYRVLKDLGLVVSVGVAADEALEDVDNRGRDLFIFAGAATLLIVLLGGVLLAARRRHARAAGEMRAAEARFKATFDQAAVGVTHADLQGRFVRVNGKFAEMLGYGPEELVGRSHLEVTHPDDVEACTARVKAVEQGLDHGAQALEKRFLAKDGREIWTSASVSLVRDVQGRPDYFIGIVEDITARKEAEGRLHEQLDDLRRFQAVTVDRELRMVELEEQLEQARATGARNARPLAVPDKGLAVER